MNKTTMQRSLLLALVIAVACLAGGCCYFSTMRGLDKAKDMAARQDYAGVVALDADCDETCEGCDQMHLIKGDACYRQAKSGQELHKKYSCAAVELQKGIQLAEQRKSGKVNLPQQYTNLCESLRNLRGITTSGAEADAINTTLLGTAKKFLSSQPANSCGLYYLNNASYVRLNPCLLHPDRCPKLCAELADVQQSLASAASGAECEPNLKKLREDVAQAKGIASCQ